MARLLSQFDIDKLLGTGTIDCFREYGFHKPKWKGTIDACGNSNNYFGIIEISDTTFINVVFLEAGECYEIKAKEISRNKFYDLEPIAKPWYATCKFPVLVIDTTTDKMHTAMGLTEGLLLTVQSHSPLNANNCRPATSADIENLIYKG